MSTPGPDDVRLRQLMIGYQSGDMMAFDQLYGALLPAMRGFLRQQTTDAERVHDLVQEAFLQIHRARHTYDPAYPVMPWAIAITRHVWLMYSRQRRRRPQPTERIEAMSLSVRGEAEAYPEQADLRAALAAIAPGRRKPFVWHHLLGLTFREIGHRLGIREDAAKLRSSRAMTELRRGLATRSLKRDPNSND